MPASMERQVWVTLCPHAGRGCSCARACWRRARRGSHVQVMQCPTCDGQGEESTACNTCGGDGRVRNSKKISLRVPAGRNGSALACGCVAPASWGLLCRLSVFAPLEKPGLVP